MFTMMLSDLNCDNIIFEEVSNDLNTICILTRPIFEVEIQEEFGSVIYTSDEIKSILIAKINKVPEKCIVSVPFNQWTDVFKVHENEYRLAGIDLGTASLHFMIIIENVTCNELYLYTGDFFTIEHLDRNDFFKANLPNIKKLFVDNKTVKYDLKTYMEILSTFIRQKTDSYSFAIYLPHLGYEDFLAALINNFKMTAHVNDLRKLLLRKAIVNLEGTFLNKEDNQPKLIVHSSSNTITKIKKLYYEHHICTLSFAHLNEFSGENPKIVDYYLTVLQWDQHPTDSMVLQLFDMVPKNTKINFIYEYYTSSTAIINHLAKYSLEETNCTEPDEFSIIDMETDLLSTTSDESVNSNETCVFLPQFASTQVSNEKAPAMPIEVTTVIKTKETDSLSNINHEEQRPVSSFCIENYRHLDLGSTYKKLRFTGKKTLNIIRLQTPSLGR